MSHARNDGTGNLVGICIRCDACGLIKDQRGRNAGWFALKAHGVIYDDSELHFCPKHSTLLLGFADQVMEAAGVAPSQRVIVGRRELLTTLKTLAFFGGNLDPWLASGEHARLNPYAPLVAPVLRAAGLPSWTTEGFAFAEEQLARAEKDEALRVAGIAKPKKRKRYAAGVNVIDDLDDHG